MKKIYILIFLLSALGSQLWAQSIQFESQDYSAFSVYDCWVNGPFRQGLIEGNVQVVDNPLKDDLNPSDKVLALQRSRFGSHEFGARIDLKADSRFELTTSKKYVHVLIYKPKAGRSMLVGLGKHNTWETQKSDVEQFWENSSTSDKVGEWYDAVFAIKGNGGIDMYSLVICPDCESTHDLSDDFFCYIDDIVVNDKSTSRTDKVDYLVNFDKTQQNTHASRKFTSMTFSSSSKASQSLTINGTYLYTDNTSTVLLAKPSDIVTSSFAPTSITWMGGYAYADWNNDGEFDYTLGKTGVEKELLAYSQYNGYDSDGMSVDGSSMYCPNYTIPAEVSPGFYRFRYKSDWNCIDPAGNNDSGNLIYQKGGFITDFLVNVHGDQVSVNNSDLNGDVTLSDGTALKNYKQNFGESFTIKINPYEGFVCQKLEIYHGYNLDGDKYVHSNKQWTKETLTVSQISSGTYTIPASWVDGDIKIVGTFNSKESPVPGEFSDDKLYRICRNNTTDYLCQTTGATGISYGTYDDSNDNYKWRLLTVDGENAIYYVQNYATQQYAQSTKITLSSAVSMGTSAVEFKIVHPSAGSFTSYWYIASNDQTIDDTVDGAMGFNYGSNGVVAYYIKNTRVNSYWDIEEAGTVTGIGELDNSETLKLRNQGVYNLAGQQVDSSYRGLLIHNGRKVLK